MKGTLNFSIRTLKSGKASIQAIHSFGRGNEVRYSIGYSLKSPSSWNSKKQRVKNLVLETEALKINTFLDKLSLSLKSNLTTLYLKKPNYNKTDVKRLFDLEFGKNMGTGQQGAKDLITYYQWYIDHFSKNPNPTTQKPLTLGTSKSFYTSFRIFREFAKRQGGLDFEDITMEVYHLFVEHLRDLNYSNNYIANNIKNLKTILNHSFSAGIHTNITHKRREFAKPNEQVFSIYLTITELKIIENLKLPPGQSESRDLFLIGAYTGLRVSDFNRLNKENLEIIDDQYYFKIQTKKTSKMQLIPCHPVVVSIIKKYDGNTPPKKQDQHINRDLKIIGAKAKFNDKITIEKTVGGKPYSETFTKADLITTHTARRSFCTNAYKANMPTIDIMAISGHQTERVFYDYIKASSLEKAQRISKHPFFKN